VALGSRERVGARQVAAAAAADDLHALGGEVLVHERRPANWNGIAGTHNWFTHSLMNGLICALPDPDSANISKNHTEVRARAFEHGRNCNRGTKVLFRLSATAAVVAATTLGVAAQSGPRVIFRASQDLVSVAVVVRGPDGRLVRDLRATDFEILDCGVPQKVLQFQSGTEADARVALLIDASGSMGVGGKRARSRLAADFLMAGFRPADEATVFSFDSRVRRLTPFTWNRDELREAVASVEPFGATRLYDAIAATARTVSEDTPRARAVLLLTDGIDTSSTLSPEDAATAAAALDLPLYVLSVGGDDEATPAASVKRMLAGRGDTLRDLATRTGGLAAEAVTAAQMSAVTRAILNELHSQYGLAFAAAPAKGWHELTVRVRRGRVHARSRDGYLVS
jgi:VWFA-related protein